LLLLLLNELWGFQIFTQESIKAELQFHHLFLQLSNLIIHKLLFLREVLSLSLHHVYQWKNI
jgi:hypothetical protein